MNLYYFRKTINAIPKSDALNGKNYLFVTIRSYSFVFHQELFFANILARNGATVYVLLDDGILPHWDTYQLHEKGMPANASVTVKNKIIRKIYTSLYHHRNIRFVKTSDLLKLKTIKNIYLKESLDESDEKNAISSVRRYFECGYYDPKNEEHQLYYSKTVNNIKLMKFFCRTLQQSYNFKAVVTSHGIYSIFGTAYNYFRNINIPVYVYGAHCYKSYHILFTDTLAQTLSLDSSCLEYMKNGVLNKENIKAVDDYLLARRNHTTKDTSIYYSWMKEKKHINIKKKESSLNYAMFPNIIWDGDVAQRDTIFNGMLDWMKKTINYFILDQQNNLIIRFHPAEATLWKDTIRLSDVIDKLYPNLNDYPNITVIRADQQIDTYEFIQNNVDVGLIYDGILSLELTHMHKPVISPSCNRYTGGTFVLSPSTIEEYYGLLKDFDLNGYFTKEKNNEFYKYAYWFLFLSAYVMPNYSEKEFGKIVYNKSSIKKLASPDFIKLYDKFMSI